MKAPDLPMTALGLKEPSGTGGEGKGEMRTLARMWVFLVTPPCQELVGIAAVLL